MAYGEFKDLARRMGSDEVLRDKAFNIAKNPKYDGIREVFLLLGIFRDLVFKSKLPPQSGSSLQAVEPHP